MSLVTQFNDVCMFLLLYFLFKLRGLHWFSWLELCAEEKEVILETIYQHFKVVKLQNWVGGLVIIYGQVLQVEFQVKNSLKTVFQPDSNLIILQTNLFKLQPI